MSARHFPLLACALALTALAVQPAFAADLAAPAPLPGMAAANAPVPACDDSAVQSAVARSIARAIPSYYDGVTVQGASHILETGVVAGQTSPYAKRYCSAQLALSSGMVNPAYYVIAQNYGFVGVSWNVETCMTGKDKWFVYGADCSTVMMPPSQ